MEALALGVPMICNQNPQMPIDIAREGCGLTVPYGDVGAWGRAIQYIIDHPDEARQMGQRGRVIALKKYNEAICAHEIATILRKYESKQSL